MRSAGCDMKIGQVILKSFVGNFLLKTDAPQTVRGSAPTTRLVLSKPRVISEERVERWLWAAPPLCVAIRLRLTVLVFLSVSESFLSAVFLWCSFNLACRLVSSRFFEIRFHPWFFPEFCDLIFEFFRVIFPLSPDLKSLNQQRC